MADKLQRIPEAPSPVLAAHEYRGGEPVTDLRQVARPLIIHRWLALAMFAAVVVLVAIYTAVVPPMYECTASLLVQGSDLKLGGAAGALGELLGTSESGPSVSNEVAILNGKQLVERAVRRSGLVYEEPSTWRVDARDTPKTNIIRVTARAQSKAKAERLCQNVIGEYLEQTRRINREAAGNAGRIVKEQLTDTERKLVEAEDRLRQFKQRTRTMALDVETRERVARLAEIVQQMEQSQAERSAAAAQAARVRALLAKQAPTVIASSQIGENPVAAQLRQTLTGLEVERAEALQEYTPTSSVVQTLDARIGDLKDRLSTLARQQADTIVRQQEKAMNPVHQQLVQQMVQLDANQAAAEARISALRQAAAAGEQDLSSLPDKEFTLAQLTRDVESYAKSFALLTAKYQELRVNEEAELANARVLEAPRGKERPVSPRRLFNMILAVALGCLLGVVSALLADQLGSKVRYSGEVAEHLGAEVLGRVRAVPAGSQLLLAELHSGDDLAEDYRSLRANVALGPSAGRLHALLITSAASAEGKSVTATNLATSFTRQGKRVLLVDSDLRRPSLHERLGAPLSPGLAELLVGKARLETVVRETAVPGLFLLPAGDSRSEAVDLLDVGRVRTLLDSLRQQYDLVVLDSPPALGAADTQVLAAAADGVLVVVGAGTTSRQDLGRLRQVMAFVRANLVGAVVNRVDLNGPDAFEAYPYYGYRSYPVAEAAAEPPRALPPDAS